MATESPATKRARLHGDADVSAAAGVQAAAAEAVAEPAAAAAAAVNGDAAVADAAATAAPSAGRRRRTISPRRKVLEADQESSAAAAAVGRDAALAEPAAAAAAAAAAVDGNAADAAPSAGRRRRRTSSPRRSVQEATQQSPAAAAAATAAAAPDSDKAAQPAGDANIAVPEVPAASAADVLVKQQQQQQQQENGTGQQQRQQQKQKQGKRARQKNNQSPTFQLVIGIHQCIKRDLPHEALHLYNKIKQIEPEGHIDTGVHSALLGLLIGKWQWELHQRHQHLLRQYQQQGRDTAALDAAAAAIVAATVQQRQQQRDTDSNILEKMSMPTTADVELPPGLVCHMEVQVELLREDKLKDRAWLDGMLEGMPADRPPLVQLLQQAVPLLLSDLEVQGQALDEQLYLQLARVAGIMGDPDKAFGYAKQLVSAYQAGGAAAAKLSPRLRDFQPALVGYALTGQADKAREVIDLALQHCTQDLTEPEFALWLEAIANGGSYQQLGDALTAMAGELNAVRGSTLQLVERFFRSERAAAALPGLGKSSWQLQWVTPDQQGRVEAAGGVCLRMLDLSESDWQAFAEQVQQLAEQQEKQAGKFQVFVDWLERNGPFDVMIDGANVALWGENYDGGAFRPDKIRVMYEAVLQQNPDAKVLLVLHSGRYNDARYNHKEAWEWLEGLRKAGRFYVAPGGSNDDWYWMYAAVQAREKGLLVSNDQLRDHVWNLLRPKHMLKWTQRHIIRFTFNFHKTEAYLRNPLPYTPCVQHFAEQGVWLLPEAAAAAAAGEEEGAEGGEEEKQQLRWLCCKPV